jgi:hypothetical protein
MKKTLVASMGDVGLNPNAGKKAGERKPESGQR